jgi:hypothetical protein
MTRALKLGLFVALITAFTSLFASARQTASRVNFERDIKPIFERSCYGCHGPAKAMSQLRLDDRSRAMRVIIPGDAKGSRLMARVLGEGGEAQMPLGGPPLSTAEIELIRTWIDQGADWPVSPIAKKHWSFIAPTRPDLPAIKDRSWPKNPIDNFVLAKIEQHGLAPSPEADRITLIRRLSLDLTGLPPTLEQIDEFVNDQDQKAYENLVERLLASPSYGERWGRHWLDVARYADTNGFEKDLARSIWPFRDWVIDAMNRDMPFDQFTIEQLAGDLLPRPTLQQRIATGFLRNSMLNEEGAVDPEQFRVEGIIDRVDAIGKAFLGLTINCAQCHSHKFDPIPQSDYYRFYAFLNSDDEPSLEVPGAEVFATRQTILDSIDKIQSDLLASHPEIATQFAEWETNQTRDESQWSIIEDATITASFGTKFDRPSDHSFVAKGDNSTKNVYVVKALSPLKKVTGVRLELLTDPSLPRGGPGRAREGQLYLSEFVLEASPADKPAAIERVSWDSATSDFNGAPIADAIDGNIDTAWNIDAGPGRRNQTRKAVFVSKRPAGFESGTNLTFYLSQKEESGFNIGRFRLSVTDDVRPRADRLPVAMRQIVSFPAASRSKDQKRDLFTYYLATDERYKASSFQIDDLMRGWPYGSTTLSLAPRDVPRETHIFKRGDWKRLGDTVTPGTPSALQPFPAGAPLNRLGLAKWIVDKQNPLTPRVIVNRMWQEYFGVGLVTTPEDFGARCESPSNPELLDWLASEFRDTGWSMKHIHRLIVSSATYRQSSKVAPKLQEADPTNVWLARAPRLRVDAEVVHDIALAAGGLLNLKVGGPSVYPAIPDGVLNLGFGAPMRWETSTGVDRYRRGMYTFWKRSVPYPSLLVFDEPNADFSCTRRIRSNTPLQALTTLNDQVFVEAAQGVALRAWREGGADDRSRVVYAFRLCTARQPDEFELQQLLKLLEEQKRFFDGKTAAAVYVSSSGELNNLPADIDLHKVAPFTVVARVILNLDETITRE